jgi:hypothetical protein
MNRRSAAAVCVGGAWATLALVAGCGADAPSSTVIPLVVRVSADGLAIAGATVRLGADARGVTGGDGLVRTAAVGSAGTPVELGVDCPAGHHLVRPPAPFVLGPAAPRHVEVECARDLARAVVVVRGRGRATEPVRLDGREVARLDGEGLAHVAVAMAPHTRFEVAVGDALGDASARATYTMPAREDVFFFEAPPPAPPPSPSSRPTGSSRRVRTFIPMPHFSPRAVRPR